MPLFALSFKADLVALTDLTIDPSQEFCLNVTCSCGAEKEGVFLTREEEGKVPGSRGTCQIVYTCKACKKSNSAVMTEDKNSLYPKYCLKGTGNWVLFATLDCRGAEPTSWTISEGWSARGAKTDTTFEDISLMADFEDFDEKAACQVKISGVETKIEKTTEKDQLKAKKSEKKEEKKAKAEKAKREAAGEEIEEVETALPDEDESWEEQPKRGKGIRKGVAGGGHANNVGGAQAVAASPKISAKKGGKGGKGK